jgi:hypothetical protein
MYREATAVFVTWGIASFESHRNRLEQFGEYSKRANLSEGANITDLTKRFDTKAYPAPDAMSSR